MTDKKQKRFRLFPNVRIQVFVQFIMIFLLILSVILFSSSSFYISMIESIYMFEMREATAELNSVNFNSQETLNAITEIENKHSVLIEIYSESEKGSSEFDETVYSKCTHAILFNNSESIEYSENFEPIVNYAASPFDPIGEYDDKSVVGTSENILTKEKHFVMVAPSDNSEYLFVTAVKHSLIDAQAKSISISAVIITLIIFISVSIAVYFYITRITKPLNDIIEVTKIMAEEKNKTIRIPPRDNLITSATDDAIFNINMMYESLMLTQERLLEKSEFLAAQLEEKEIEQKSRAEFIAGTSHELKTPISIIQGYAEGIKYVLDDRAAAEEYCDTIIDECARMTNLVVNMMSLSNIQHSDHLNYSHFSINEFIDERLKLHQKVFEKSGISASSSIEDKIFGCGDISKLQFVINNLLSNAISYIGGEEKLINVRYEDKDLCYRIYVFNTGEHISPEALQKLWDSFYRQDAARLRSEGHFGLGLSIVKAVQDAHSQQCGVDNAEGGVTFWFDVAKGKEIKKDAE